LVLAGILSTLASLILLLPWLRKIPRSVRCRRFPGRRVSVPP